jgi:hypothetical protein
LARPTFSSIKLALVLLRSGSCLGPRLAKTGSKTSGATWPLRPWREFPARFAAVALAASIDVRPLYRTYTASSVDSAS